MGGFGSGYKWGWSKRATCEASFRIDLRYMRKKNLLEVPGAGTLSWSQGGRETGSVRYRLHSDALELDYRSQTNGGPWQNINERVPLVRTKQPYGGERAYFLCPTCYKRCLVLYGGSYFRCRTCQHLTYSSQNETGFDRLNSKASRIRARLGDGGSFDDPFPAKPKGMHWKTYERLEKECSQIEDEVAETFAILVRRFVT